MAVLTLFRCISILFLMRVNTRSSTSILCESKYVRLQKSEVVQCAVFHATPAWSHEAASDAKSSLRAHRSERGIQFVTFSSCQTEFLLHPIKLSGVGL